MDFTDCWYVNQAIAHENDRWQQFFNAYGDADGCECDALGWWWCPIHA